MNSKDPISKTKVKHIRRRELAEISDVLSTKSGRMFVWRILENAGIFRSSMSDSPNWTAFREGARSLGLSIYADMMEACPARLMEMSAEAKNQKLEDGTYGE